MKFISLIQISRRHIASRKRQNILSVITIGILFGIMLGAVFLFEGLEDVFVRTSNSLSGRKLYVTSNSCMNNVCLDWEALEPYVRQKSSAYNGEIVGKVDIYTYKNGGHSFKVVNEDFVKDVIEINLNQYNRGTLFKIISLDEADKLVNSPDDNSYVYGRKTYSLSEIEALKAATVGKTFSESFSVPTSTFVSEELLEGDPALEELSEEANYEEKTLEYVVAGVIGSSRTPTTISQGYRDIRILDFFLSSVSNRVIEPDLYVARDSDTTINYRELFDASERNTALPIIEFKSLDDAYAYYSAEDCNIEENLGKCTNYTVSELVGDRLNTTHALNILYYYFNYGEIALLLVAITISVFTFIRLVGENAKSIALYRSLGASSLEILVIYFFYLLELCLMTVFFSTVLGLGIAVVISLKDASVLSAMLTSLFAENVHPGLLIGLSPEVTKIIAAILLTAPICSVLTLDQLSTKNIAKKIKG